MVYLLLVFLLGALTPVQTAANARLRRSVSSPLVASFVSFSVGTLYLLAATLVQQGTLFVGDGVAVALPWWAWMGGLCGLYGLTVNILIFPKLGSVQTALMPMIGQIGMGMLIDTFGWFRSAAYPLSWLRLAALALILAGVCMAVMKKSAASRGGGSLLPWQVLGVSGGAIFAMQPPMNSLLAAGLSSAVHAAFVSFLSATAALLILVLLLPDRRSLPSVFRHDGRPWWAWLGGIIGGTFVTGFAFFAAKVGVGLLLVTSICGLLTFSLVIDKYGLLGAERKPIGMVQYAGLLCVIAGIALLRLS